MHRGNGIVVGLRALFRRVGKKGKSQQHPAAGLGWGLGAGINQPRQGGITEALRELKALGACQIEMVAMAAGGQAEAGCSIPEEPEGVARLQQGQLLQRVHPLQWQGHGEHPVVSAVLIPGAQSGGQHVCEACVVRAGGGRGLHPIGTGHRAAQMYGSSFGLHGPNP